MNDFVTFSCPSRGGLTVQKIRRPTSAIIVGRNTNYGKKTASFLDGVPCVIEMTGWKKLPLL